MIKLYLFSKKIHRILVIVIITLGIIMSVTGTTLKYPFFARLFNLDLGLIRQLHNNLSPFFVVVLLLMSLTGLMMYSYPLLRKR